MRLRTKQCRVSADAPALSVRKKSREAAAWGQNTRSATVPRFLHTADWQIGKPYHWIEEPQKRARVQQERVNAVSRIAAIAREQNLDAVMVAGDLFDSSTVAPALVMEVMEAIASIPCPVLVIPGNHDHGGAGGIWQRRDVQRQMGERCPNLKLFLQTEPQVIAGMVLLPCPLLRQRDSRSPADWLESLNWSALPQDQPRVVLAHGSVQGFGAEEQINQLHHNRWPEQEVDYIALGDWHALTQLNARAWYCGTPEPDRFPTSDQDQRSQALLVDLKRQQPPEVTPIPIGAISWHRIEAKVSSGADLQRLKASIESCVGSKVGKDLLRLELSGQLSFQEHQQLQQHLQDLNQQLLHLRIRGMPNRRPEPGEFQTFLQRDDAPLIQGITTDLAAELEANSTASADHGDIDRAMLEQAMLELQRIVLEEAETQEASCD